VVPTFCNNYRPACGLSSAARHPTIPTLQIFYPGLNDEAPVARREQGIARAREEQICTNQFGSAAKYCDPLSGFLTSSKTLPLFL
jgi:hypothetical protein